MNTSKTRTVVAIGNFDGVHKGHAQLLSHARLLADAKGFELVVLTFEPHPRSFFKPDEKSFRLTPENLKEARLKVHGVDRVEVMDFNAIMAKLSAAMFIDIMLVDLLNAGIVVVGDDFHFGHNREGTIHTLKGDRRFETEIVKLMEDSSTPISSTRIRNALYASDIAAANAMLGWDWEIRGEVIHGDKRGRELGYPTANMLLDETICPAQGIYAVRIDVGDNIWRAGAASMGVRPMFTVKKPLLEVYVFDFEGDLYGKTIRVQPVKYLRPEMKFETLDALKAQMKLDCDEARTLLGKAV